MADQAADRRSASCSSATWWPPARHVDRAALQQRLVAALGPGQRDPSTWCSRCTSLLGDEFQGAAALAGRRAAAGGLAAPRPAARRRAAHRHRPRPVRVFDPDDRRRSPRTGPRWWAARRAVEEAAEDGARPATRHVRSRLVALGADGEPPTDDRPAGARRSTPYSGCRTSCSGRCRRATAGCSPGCCRATSSASWPAGSRSASRRSRRRCRLRRAGDRPGAGHARGAGISPGLISARQ